MSKYSQEIRWNVQHDKSMYQSPRLQYHVDVPDILKQHDLIWTKDELEETFYPEPKADFRHIGYHRSGKGRVEIEKKVEKIEDIIHGGKE